MSIPDSRFRRVATLVAIDTSQCVALLRRSSAFPPLWALPRQTVRLAETYVEAVVQLANRLFRGQQLRWGSVVGRRWAPVPVTPRVRVEEHVFIARAGSLQTSAGSKSGKPEQALAWIPRASLEDALREPYGDTTATLVDGYLDGWLPDGPITLD